MEIGHRIGKGWEWFKNSRFYIIYDKIEDCAVRSAALSYYTLSGLISFCIFELWICKVMDIDSYVAEAVATIFGNASHEALGMVAMDRLLTIKETWACAALAVILISVTFTIDNLSTVFDRIMLTQRRDSWLERQLKCTPKALIATLTIMAAAYLICTIPGNFMKYLALWMALCILLWLALKFLPAESPFNWKNAIYASVVSASLVTVVLQPLKVIYSYLTGPFGIMLILICLYFSWFVILETMLLFSNISNDGRHYYYKETENISGMFKTYLTIIVASYVFKNWKKTMGCTFEDIREHAITDRFGFPSSALNRILKKLVKKEILEVDKEFKYLPHRRFRIGRADDMTVGDLLFELQFRGEYDLSDDISYQSLNVQLANDLDRYFMQHGNLGSLSQKLSEIEFKFEEGSDAAGIQKEQWGYCAKKKSYDLIKQQSEAKPSFIDWMKAHLGN